MHDPAYKLLFSRPRMVRDLLDGIAARGWSGALDFDTLAPLLAPYQPSQRYCLLDGARVADADLPADNLVSALIGLEKSRDAARLGEALEALGRTTPRLTQEELARRLGTTQSAIARLEGGRVSPSFATLRRYAEATGTRLTVGLISADG